MINAAALFDLDGTLSRGGIWNGFFKYYLTHNKKRAWILTFWVIHSALWLLSKCKLYSGEKCRVKWMENLSGVFKGASIEETLDVFNWVSDRYVFKSLRSDIIDILNQHKRNGDVVIIVSAAYSELVEIVGQGLDVPNAIGTKLEVIDGKYNGKIVQPPCFSENKVKLLEEFISRNELEIDLSASSAYADSIFDTPLLEMVGNPVATYPDRDLCLLAKHKGWRILP